MILASVEESAFEGQAAKDFFADLGKIVHAVLERVDVQSLSEDDIDSLGIVYNSE